MKLFTFILFAIASLVAKAAPGSLRDTAGSLLDGQTDKTARYKPSPYVPRKLGPRNLGEDVTFNREYNEDGEPPAGRQIQVSIDYPVDEPETTETLLKPSEDEHDGDGHRKLYYNCYSYCWWHWYYGYITYCCPYWGCAYYYC